MAKKKRKRRILKIKNILIFLLILILLGISIYYIITLPINNIYIKGNKILDDNMVLELANIDDYPSFILTPSNKIRSKLLKNNYIRDVKIKKKFGNVIDINIEEYTPIAVLESNKKLILSNGKIEDNVYNITDVPILTNEVDGEVYNNFIKKMSIVNGNVLRQVSEIVYSPVDVDKERFLLYMDDGNLVYITLTKIKRLNKYNDIKSKMGNKIGTIYLDFGKYVELKKEVNDEKSGD